MFDFSYLYYIYIHVYICLGLNRDLCGCSELLTRHVKARHLISCRNPQGCAENPMIGPLMCVRRSDRWRARRRERIFARQPECRTTSLCRSVNLTHTSPVRPARPLDGHTLENIGVPCISQFTICYLFFCFLLSAPGEEREQLWPTWNGGHQTHGSMNQSILAGLKKVEGRNSPQVVPLLPLPMFVPVCSMTTADGAGQCVCLSF